LATLKELRERQKLRTVDVASKVGIAESTVRNWEKSRSIPNLNVYQLATLLGVYDCTFEELLQAVSETQKNLVA
jgi:putative transcriptional regulator